MADWYVYQHDGDPLGPWSTDAVADAILAGRLAPDVWVAAPGGPRWLRALDIPVIGRLVEGIPTRPRRDSGLRLIPSASALEAAARAATANASANTVEQTMMIVDDDEVVLTDAEASAMTVALPPVTQHAPNSAVDTARYPVRDFTIEEPDAPTDRALPPSSSPRTPSGSPGARARANEDALEAPSTDRRRRRKNA